MLSRNVRPTQYTFQGLCVNEFEGARFDCDPKAAVGNATEGGLCATGDQVALCVVGD
jgi:hypothetical protein